MGVCYLKKMEKTKNKSLFINSCKKGLLSSIIVTFNSEKYMFDAIQSVLNQDYPEIELIISDDGSRDFDEQAIRNYIDNNKNNNIVNTIIIHREKNLGTVRNINYALKNVSGEFIKILGGDDTYPDNRVFSKQVQIIQGNNSLAVVGKAKQCNDVMEPIYDSRVERSNKGLPVVLSMDYKSARKYISKQDIFPIAIQAVCYKRSFFERNGFCDEDYVLIDDAPSALMILKESKNISYMDAYTVNHRAKVGISSSRELFAARRLLYYKDCVKYAKKEVDAYPDIYNFLYRKENVRINEFVYKAAKIKADKKSSINIGLLGIMYIDAIIYYICANPKKFIARIMDRIKHTIR